MRTNNRIAARLPTLGLSTATLLGFLGGFAVGAIVGPVGVVLGIVSGVAVGQLAGRVLAREDAKATARTRELDAIIGISHGPIGAAPVALVARSADLDTWAAEWLTPPPPRVAG